MGIETTEGLHGSNRVRHAIGIGIDYRLAKLSFAFKHTAMSKTDAIFNAF